MVARMNVKAELAADGDEDDVATGE
jgi:hypothetical protein